MIATRSLRAPFGFAVVASLLVPSVAAAMSCSDIMNMVRVNVPSDIVVGAMEGSGTKFSADDIACLTREAAPAEILAAAKRMAAPATAAPIVPDDEDAVPTAQPRQSTYNSTQSLGSSADRAARAADFERAAEATGDDDAEGGDTPAQVEQLIGDYRAKKFLTASFGLHELLEKNAFPEHETKIKYYLGKALYDLGMYHAAQYYFLEVVRKGQSNPFFKHALPRLAAIAEYTGNDYELLRFVHKIPPESFPTRSKPHLYYLLGRKSYEAGELSEASSHFSQVPNTHELYPRAQYFRGVIEHEIGNDQSAVRAFREVVQVNVPVTDDKTLSEIEDLKDLSLMNIARIYFALDKFDNAEKYYTKVDRDSIYWPQSLFERAWTNFYRNDLNLTLGMLLTVNAPDFAAQEFLPETDYLRALTYFNLCDYKEVERVLTQFDLKYGPMKAELKTFLEQYKDDSARQLADQAFDAWFVNGTPNSKLSASLFSRVLRNRDLASLLHHLELMDKEQELIAQQKSTWKDGVGDALDKIIEADRQRYKKRAGQVLLQALLEEYRTVEGLLSDSQVLRFEVVDAQRVDYGYRASNPEVETEDEKKVDFATSKTIIYWPFNGEFWADELGYYRYTQQTSCK